MDLQTAKPATGTTRPLHDLANVIGAILLSAQSHLLTDDLEDPELREDLEDIVESARAARSLIATLRSPT